MAGKLITVVGGQFGSEAKGHVAGRLAEREMMAGVPVVAVRVAGPNAGHTAYDAQGRPWPLRTIPVMAVTNLQAKLVIAAGSEIQLSVLRDEIEQLEAAGIPVVSRLYIDGQATLLEDRHIETETGLTMHERLGSTGKGIGAARADRALRKAKTWQQAVEEDQHSYPGWLGCVDTAAMMVDWAATEGATVIIEGTQGYGLGLHAGHYPYCTSSDCRAIDFLAMAGLNPWDSCFDAFENWVVMRTYPIRVAGNSGDLYAETDWESLAALSGGYITPERTTVTKKIRRIGRWDDILAEEAIRANGGAPTARIALTFLDYIDPSGANKEELTPPMQDFIDMVEQHTHARVRFAATGPNSGVWL